MTDRKGEVKWLKQPSAEDWQAFQKAVGPKYSQVSESIRRVAPGGLTCSMFCGGKNCKYDNPAKFKAEDMAVSGLYSSWVTDEILAMSRPSCHAVKEYNIIDQFKQKEIRSIINLQHPGEHASCGFGLQPSGFSYNPQEFMDEDVFYYNYGWNDYGVRSLHSILDIVKVMDFAISGGKIAVHCHAGLGRTGVVIACYLIFRDRMEADEAIHLVRKRRPKAIQTRGQIGCVKDFAKYLKPMRNVFCLHTGDEGIPKSFTLDEFLLKQKNLLHGEEERKLRYVPKIVYILCQRILELANVTFDLGKVTSLARKGLNAGKATVSLDNKNDTTDQENDNSKLNGDIISTKNNGNNVHARSSVTTPYSITEEVQLNRNRSQSLCQGIDKLDISNVPFSKCRSDVNLCGMKGDIYDSGSVTLSEATSMDLSNDSETSDSLSRTLDDSDGVVINEPLGRNMSQVNQGVVRGLEPDSMIGSQFGRGGKLEPLHNRKKGSRTKKGKRKEKSTAEMCENVVHEAEENDNDAVEHSDPMLGSVESSTEDNSLQTPVHLELQELCKCLASRTVESKVLVKVDRYKRKLNTSSTTWTQLQSESDIRVLGSLLWGWLEHLKYPVLKSEQLQVLCNKSDAVNNALTSMDRNSRKTFECLLVTLSKLQPIPDNLSQRLLRRLAIALTKDKTLSSNPTPGTSQERSKYNNEGMDSHLPYSGNGQVCLDFMMRWMAELSRNV